MSSELVYFSSQKAKKKEADDEISNLLSKSNIQADDEIYVCCISKFSNVQPHQYTIQELPVHSKSLI